MFQYLFNPAAAREFKKLPQDVKLQLISDLRKICSFSHPLKAPNGLVKKLKGFSVPTYRIRSKKYRIRFQIEKENIFITKVAHRNKIYL